MSSPTPARPTGKNRHATAPAAGGLFFPQSKSLGIDLSEHSPAIQQKIVAAGCAAPSFAKAADLLDRLADLSVLSKPVERLTRSIGTERVAQRDAAVAAFVKLPLAEKFQAPAGVVAPEVAVVFVDGGRLQIRERTSNQAQSQPPVDAGTSQPPLEAGQWEEEVKPAKGYWREGRHSLLAQMDSPVHSADPCPDLPAGFLDVLRIPLLASQIGKVAAGAAAADARAEAAELPEIQLPQEAAYQPPDVTQRRVLGSCRPWSEFTLIVAEAAWAAGFQLAKRKAFVADGSANNWRMQMRYFGSFVPVLDFIHALTYVYAGAMAGQAFGVGWECYQKWIAWLWQGKVSAVIEELQKRQEEVGRPQEGESETSVASVVGRTLGYMRNHQEKMKYDEYRKAGLPITSSLMESTVKQMNYRVKGSEKFWCQQGAEAIVQLRADLLSDDDPLDEFWRKRQVNATGQRPYRRAA